MKQPISAETLFEEFVEQIKTAVDAVATQVPYNRYTENMWVFNKYYSVDKACKKLIFTLIPEAYFRSFKNKYTWYANVKCLDILSHLWTTYGSLQGFEVQENYVRTKQTITDETLFE